MAKGSGNITIKINFDEVGDMEQKVVRLAGPERYQFFTETTEDLTQRMYKRAKENTKKGDYSDYLPEYEKQGGTMKKSWEAEPVRQDGNKYIGEVWNGQYYALFVELGHRQHVGQFIPPLAKRAVNSWVDGRFWMTDAAESVAEQAPDIIRNKYDKFVRGVMGD